MHSDVEVVSASLHVTHMEYKCSASAALRMKRKTKSEANLQETSIPTFQVTWSVYPRDL